MDLKMAFEIAEFVLSPGRSAYFADLLSLSVLLKMAPRRPENDPKITPKRHPTRPKVAPKCFLNTLKVIPEREIEKLIFDVGRGLI